MEEGAREEDARGVGGGEADKQMSKNKIRSKT